ncbi:ABC transporter ATP-binding protein [Candidatus Bathyarchaeota archaeon]|nr:ABC transporter ATP-binding protein [Candidatus Bathyarchaeota archaeon]
MPAIQLRDVSKRFGDTRALESISFDVKDGEYLCILGSTGSGKTTLLRTISGIIKPDQGEILYDNKNMKDVAVEDRNAVYVPQTYALFPHLTVIENVCFGPISKGVDLNEAKNRALQILKLVKLDKRANSYPNELSGGMQQRVALARGIASNTKLLLLDEPLGALDARLRLELRVELKKIAQENGLTVIHVTHDQEEAMSIGDRIMILRKGRIQQIGTPLHVYLSPQNIFVANFIGNTNFIEGTILKRNTRGSSIRIRGGYQIMVDDTSHVAEEPVVTAIREEKIKLFDHPIEAKNTLSGDLIGANFLGTFIRYEVKLDNGDILAALHPPNSDLTKLRLGDRVAISFETFHTKIFDYPVLGLKRELEAY